MRISEVGKYEVRPVAQGRSLAQVFVGTKTKDFVTGDALARAMNSCEAAIKLPEEATRTGLALLTAGMQRGMEKGVVTTICSQTEIW